MTLSNLAAAVTAPPSVIYDTNIRRFAVLTSRRHYTLPFIIKSSTPFRLPPYPVFHGCRFEGLRFLSRSLTTAAVFTQTVSPPTHFAA